MSLIRRATATTAALALTLFLAGCGDDSDADQAPDAGSGSAATASSGSEPSTGSDEEGDTDGESESDGDEDGEATDGGEPDGSESGDSSPSLVPSSVTVESFCDKIDAKNLSEILGVDVPQFGASNYKQQGITAESCSAGLQADDESGAIFLEVRTGKAAVPRNITAFQEKSRGASAGVTISEVPGVPAKRAAAVTLDDPPFSSVYVAVGKVIFECGMGVPAGVTQPSAEDSAVICLGILAEIAS